MSLPISQADKDAIVVCVCVCVRLELKWMRQKAHEKAPPSHSVSGFKKVELKSSGANVSLGRVEHIANGVKSMYLLASTLNI